MKLHIPHDPLTSTPGKRTPPAIAAGGAGYLVYENICQSRRAASKAASEPNADKAPTSDATSASTAFTKTRIHLSITRD